MDRTINGLMRTITILLAIVFVFAVCLNFANVVARYAFSTSILGADEVQIYIMIWITFLGAAVVTWDDRHLRMDVFAGMMPRSARYVLQLAEQALLVILAGFAVVQSAQYANNVYGLDLRSDGGQFPMWIPHGALLAGLSLITLIALLRLIRLLLHPGKAVEPAPPADGATP